VYHDPFSVDNAIPVYGIIKANVLGRSLMCTTLTILHHGIYSAPCGAQGFLFYFTPYFKISGESDKKCVLEATVIPRHRT